MLTQTFVHLSGIGPATERKLWAAGVLDWDRALAGLPSEFGPNRQERWARELEESRRGLDNNDARYFASRLATKHRWRLYPTFRNNVAFLDIETTGLDFHGDEITTVVLYDGEQVRTYVNGQNLGDLAWDLARYQLLVTYNGRCFDLPFIEAKLSGLRLDQAHIDLRYLLASLGFRGGLKGCERQLGLKRPEGLQEVDGLMAVRFWRAHRRGDKRALPALLRYNAEDTVNLRWLMETAYNLAAGALPVKVQPLEVAERPPVEIPFDPTIIEELSRQSFGHCGQARFGLAEPLACRVNSLPLPSVDAWL